MELTTYAVAALIGYLLGSLPTGYLAGRMRGIDIRQSGSGNIGATNVFRVLGKPAGIIVLIIDALKGYVASAWVPGLIAAWFPTHVAEPDALRITAGLAAIMGHNFTCWLRFRGGKGIATSAGVLIALVPGALIIITCIWIIVFAFTRYVSLASICASFALPFATWLTGQNLALTIVTSAMAALAIYKHRSNIQRLMQGTEHRFGKPREAQS
ncbi:MAG TPA: glycerol-3-phosphate 1-O-acyltransferase PlsY [Verrucomicrobiae bacterium]|nr:glycerol-3-phosphate 1-O-acyltransferase PlsY [Verrucomicrobiae bacterium]